MTFNEIEKEYWETFDINQGTDKINGYPIIKISDTYSRPATVEDFESFYKQSFIKYLQNQSDTIEVPLNDKTTTDYWQGWIDGQEQIKLKLQAQIKELESIKN